MILPGKAADPRPGPKHLHFRCQILRYHPVEKSLIGKQNDDLDNNDKPFPP